MQPNPLDLREVLLWLAGAGAPVVVGYLLSLVAENVPAWHTLDSRLKFVIPLVVSVLIGIGANLLLAQTEVVATLSPVWTLVVGAILAYLGSQTGYLNAKRVGYGEWARTSAIQSQMRSVPPK